MRLFTAFSLLFIFFISTFATAAEKPQINKFSSSKSLIKKYSVNSPVTEPVHQAIPHNNQVNNSDLKPVNPILRKNGTATHVLVDSSRNGFGWLNSGIRSIDRFSGEDVMGAQVDFLLLGYRQYILSDLATGIIGATTIDVENGLASGNAYRYVELNQDLYSTSLGGRYPGVVALDRPFVAFNQYISGDAETAPAISHPYLLTDYGSYGDFGGAWTPSYQMDTGYNHHTFPENRLWNGSVSIVKGNDDKYHYVGAYRNWTIEGETQPNEYVILNAESEDPTFDWTIDTSPTLIDTMDFVLHPTVAINAGGFGAFVGLGHAGTHEGDTFFMSELRLMLKTTTDYGKSWTEVREVSWAELGIPEVVTPSDSILIPANPDDPADTTYVLADTSAYVAIPNNHSVDVIVSDEDDIYIGFDLLWGPFSGENSYYRNYRWGGVHMAVSNDGGASFKDSHIAYNNGFFVGDESSDEAEDNFVHDSEVELSTDELGNLYATWLDRPNTGIEAAEHLRYDRTNQEILLKTDVYTSRSLDGGITWSPKMNVTETQSIDEYELKAVRHTSSKNNGTIHFAYCTVDPATEVTQGDPDTYTHRVNRIWVGEAGDYPDSVTVGIEDDGNSKIARDYALEQNYPNPFNPGTRIEFLPLESGKATLEIFNVTGQKIAVIYNDVVQKDKKYHVVYQADNLAAGVYFYRFKMKNTSEVRKMILMK